MPRRTRTQRRTKTTYKRSNVFYKDIMDLCVAVANHPDMRHAITEPINDPALEWLCQIIDCDLCASLIVEIAKGSCCQACFERWVFLNDGRKCPLCEIPVREAMTREEVDTLGDYVKLKTKRLGKSGHYTQALVNYRIEACAHYMPN